MDITLTKQELANPTVIEARLEYLTRKNAEFVALLRQAQELRPILLRQNGHVPECVLHFCNLARAAVL